MSNNQGEPALHNGSIQRQINSLYKGLVEREVQR